MPPPSSESVEPDHPLFVQVQFDAEMPVRFDTFRLHGTFNSKGQSVHRIDELKLLEIGMMFQLN